MQSEAYFYHIWEKYPLGINILLNGDELVIHSKGVLSQNMGPDFQGARISYNGSVYSGDIEIHLRTSDWYHHGHHLNADYDNVILHLVWNKEDRKIITRNNLTIPELSFQDLQAEAEEESQVPDLVELFFRRYIRKLTYCQELLQFYSPEDVIWILFARALGYKQNADTMELFARVFYPARIRQYILNKTDSESILLAAAFRKKIAVDEALLTHLPKLQVPWRCGGRPANSPERRIRYLSCLIIKHWDSNLFNVVKEIIIERKPWNYIVKSLSHIFRVADSSLNPGRDRMTVFIINWLLPLMHAVYPEQKLFQRYLLDLYFSMPAETITRQIPGPMPSPANAAESQGVHEWFEIQKGDFQPWIRELRIPYDI